MLCVFLLLSLPKALICYCICGQKKLEKCKIPYSLQMLNVDPVISKSRICAELLSVPVLGYLPKSHLNSLSNCVTCIVFLSFISHAEISLTPSGKKSLIVSIAKQLQVGESASLVSWYFVALEMEKQL